ncbi:glycosyltransferase [Cupriavidus taiwanensis]|uniref:Glycosyltransferase involved in capsule biosynthesis, similar to kpsS n=1 Tax=Cupriavidus taiwanensis (strain DSM 17343 / BCRC 17206 / CCUG 44338 / CIP 107171 / LMG 19424 / R1) TaxID=977880 RepID=B3R9X4_CUPTR|nr:glycosyltransferase [Cupriavidus taiwanensis]CAQ71699.1 putative glycosyltransferase involved in capsule biosynthesis, similar to kpsS [Cupriavidus taiwanensis LMG 19424]
MHANEKKLTVAIPVRWASDRSDLLERLTFARMDTDLPDGVEILIVDDGSPQALAVRLEAECRTHGYAYHRLQTEHLPFSIGRARNAAAQCGLSDYIMFQDVDLMPYAGFYREVLGEAVVNGLDESVDNFLMFGVIYLTEAATQDFKKMDPRLRRQKYIQMLLQNDQSAIEKFSTGTSVTVWRRDYFLATGGNDPDFNGWGYEDLEYACRAIRRRKKFPLPSEFALDYRNFQSIVEYKGWKSIYRLFGDMTFQKGMVLFHAWHPVEHKSDYMAAKAKNRRLFERKLADFRDKELEPDPLPMHGSGKSLVLRNNPWVTNRWIAPFLGEIVHIDEDHLPADTFMAFLRESGFDRVVFHNPYANPRMKALYDLVRANQFPFLVVERGALPDSVFFDPCGFNADSASYSPERWDKELSCEKRTATLEYIQRAVSDEESLEAQSPRLGAASLRKALRIGRGKKVLVAFLQRPTDTVIENFMGPMGTYENFLRLLARLPFALRQDWELLVKQHPLETDVVRIPGAINVDQCNTKDLLELCDAMIAVNSGVGVLGLAFGKLVLHCGQAFYGAAGLTHHVLDEGDVVAVLNRSRPDYEKALRFLSYLVNDFYSFGKFKTRKVAWHDGSFMTATTAIDFYKIRFPGRPEMTRKLRDTVEVSSDSVLFDRYRAASARVPAMEKVSAPAKAGKEATAKPAPVRVEVPRQVPVDTPRPARAEPKTAPPKAAPAKPTPSWRRKAKKLMSNPVMFFRDSKHAVFRAIGNRVIVK